MSDNEKVEERNPNEVTVETSNSEKENTAADAQCAEGGAAEAKPDELAVLTDKYLRLNAEFDNFRKRNAKERIELVQTASLDVIRDLLDVLDDCSRTEQMLENKNVEIKALKEGVQLVFNKLRKTLENKGLQSFDSIREVFDVSLHEAITEIPAPNKKMRGKVVDEVQKGYNLNGKLIRHAKVVIGK